MFSTMKDVCSLCLNYRRQYVSKYTADLVPQGCIKKCNDLTSVKSTNNMTEAYTFRMYCKKACDEDGSFDDCLGMCKELCWKDPISDNPNLTILDRSPGDPESSNRCYKVCMAGCRFRDTDEDKKDSIIPDDSLYVPHLSMYCTAGNHKLRCSYWGIQRTLSTKVLLIGGIQASCVTKTQVMTSCFHGVFKHSSSCCTLQNGETECTCPGTEGISYPLSVEEKYRNLITPLSHQNNCIFPEYASSINSSYSSKSIFLNMHVCSLYKAHHMWRFVAIDKFHTEDATFAPNNFFTIRNSPFALSSTSPFHAFNDQNTCLARVPLPSSHPPLASYELGLNSPMTSISLVTCHASLGSTTTPDDHQTAVRTPDAARSMWELISVAQGFFQIRSIADPRTLHRLCLRARLLPDDSHAAMDVIQFSRRNDGERFVLETAFCSNVETAQVFSVSPMLVEGKVNQGFLPILEVPLSSRIMNPILTSVSNPPIRVLSSDALHISGVDIGSKLAKQISSHRNVVTDLARDLKSPPLRTAEDEARRRGVVDSSTALLARGRAKMLETLSSVASHMQETRRSSRLLYLAILVAVGGAAGLFLLFADNVLEFIRRCMRRRLRRRDSWTALKALEWSVPGSKGHEKESMHHADTSSSKGDSFFFGGALIPEVIGRKRGDGQGH